MPTASRSRGADCSADAAVAGAGSDDARARCCSCTCSGRWSRPGIVELRPGARVVDAIASAGGLAADANPAGVNLARPVSDGEQLVVPREGEELAPQAARRGEPAETAAGSGSLVNLNLASVTELQALPRIGPALAQRIVDWRESERAVRRAR